jgi:CheY-like chemotaxis protein/nitrogen-specific signal transduction histidine kinase
LRIAHLHRQNEKLNRLVAERTRELELSNTAKSEFLENVSHEIRNPLQGMIGLVKILKEERLAPEERELARSLKATVEHLRRVSEEILEFSKLEYGYGSVEDRPFLLGPLVQGIVDLYRAESIRNGNAIEVVCLENFDDGFLGDSGKIKSILGNFLSNALKYAPGKPVEITVSCEPTDAEHKGAAVILAVTDRGPGVAADEQDLIFQKFVRGTQAMQRRVAGTGIGLATCRLLAKQIGGNVGLESIPGQGATFHLWAPLKRARIPMRSSVNQPVPGEDRPPSGTSLLVVDDEDYNRTVLRGIALELGYLPYAAADAVEAFAHIHERHFGIVFLDLELPGIKGEQIAAALRTRTECQDTIIIATTAHDSDEMRSRCYDVGMDGFILKPFGVAQMKAELARVMARLRGDTVPMNAALGKITVSGGDGFESEIFRLYDRGAPEGKSGSARDRYNETLARDMEKLSADYAAENIAAIKIDAHRLRSLSAMVEAEALNRAAQRIEEAARDGDLAACREPFAEARLAWADLRTRLNGS